MSVLAVKLAVKPILTCKCSWAIISGSAGRFVFVEVAEGQGFEPWIGLHL